MLTTLLQNFSPVDKGQMFEYESDTFEALIASVSETERDHILDVLFAITFQVFGSGVSDHGLSVFIHLLSSCLEKEADASSKDAQDKPVRSGLRKAHYDFAIKACTLLYFFLRATPTMYDFYEHFAATCGSIQGGAAWILNALVNSRCDKIRGLGLRCIAVYVSRTSKNDDAPLSLDRPVVDLDRLKLSDGPNNALSLISNVGQGALLSNVATRLAAIGPSVRSALLSPSKLTPKIVYKLIWHILKSHRYDLGAYTQSSLIEIVLEDSSSAFSIEQISDSFLKANKDLVDEIIIDTLWADAFLIRTSLPEEGEIRSSLYIGLILRQLRFLPAQLASDWLVFIRKGIQRSVNFAKIVVGCAEWQPCLFQYISELLEMSTAGTDKDTYRRNGNKIDGILSNTPEENKSMSDDPESLLFRLDSLLDIYAALLGHSVRSGENEVSLVGIHSCSRGVLREDTLTFCFAFYAIVHSFS